jgi:hypothetical protein
MYESIEAFDFLAYMDGTSEGYASMAFDFLAYMDGTSEGYASMAFNSEMASKIVVGVLRARRSSVYVQQGT